MQDGPGASPERPEGRPGRRRGSPVKTAVQLVGFAVGLALLWWCVSLALKPENREQLEKLSDAGAGPLALLFLAPVATLVINGLVFWIMLLPERRLPIGGVMATNAIATMLAYLPFKLSVIGRFAIHNRRDGVPILTIAAWMGAVAVTVLAGLGPVAGVSVWRGAVDWVWWVASGVGVVGLTAVSIAVSGYFAHDRGLGRIHRVLDPFAVGPLKGLLRGDAFRRLHGAFAMLAHPGAVWAAVGLRLGDVAVQSVRMVVAAAALGVELSPEHAVLVASTYFMIGMLSPFGMLGTREAGSVGLAELLGFGEAGDSLVVVILAVSATESLVNLACGAAGVAWLRPDRLLKLRRSPQDPDAPP